MLKNITNALDTVLDTTPRQAAYGVADFTVSNWSKPVAVVSDAACEAANFVADTACQAAGAVSDVACEAASVVYDTGRKAVGAVGDLKVSDVLLFGIVGGLIKAHITERK